ncbi:hypothetical protein CMO88_00925 [Candidatus Woesearchaeota archaeon]|nr:hypothetical protein [Candidatus Woesearchaeota archaeon]|tara:strand:+ start:5808 stop:8072 length:2265 start_codon:yes stop_codon:yes gene_type:complete
MKVSKYYHVGGIAWILVFAYLQLFLAPNVRNCALENGLFSSSISSALQSCTSLSLSLTIAILGLLTAVMLLALKQGYFTELYDRLEKKKREWSIVAVLISLATLAYLSKGDVVLGDAMQFSALIVYVKQALTSLTYPFWTFYWYMGSAPFAFYGWLHSFVFAIVNIFVGINWTNKIMFFLLHLGSALLMYKFVKVTTNNSKIAIISALVYGLSFEHMARVMIGRSITSLTYFLTPLLFLVYSLRLNKKLSTNKAVAGIAAIVALLMFNHPDSVFIVAIFVLYAGFKAIEERKLKEISPEMVISLLLAFVLISFWTVPMLVEKAETSGTDKTLEIFMPKAPRIEVVKEMVSWPGKWGAKQLYYLGLSSLLLSILGMYYLSKQRKFAITVTTLTVVILLIIQTTRYAPVMLLMLSLSAGYGFMYLNKKLKFDSRKLLFLILAIMIVDMVPATLQLGYPDFSYKESFYNEIKAGSGERILDLSTNRRIFWQGEPYLFNKDEALFGALIESAPRSTGYAASISTKAAQEIYDLQQDFSEETLQGLYLLGVKQVIVHQEQIGKDAKKVFAEKKDALGLERNFQAIELNHSPIIASNQKTLAGFPELEKEHAWELRTRFEDRNIDFSEVSSILNLMQVDTEKRVAGQILVKDSSNEFIASKDLEIDIKEARTRIDKAEIDYKINSDAFLQLSYSHSPYLSVKIDGKETEYWKTAINTIAVKTEPGEHTITIQGKQSTLRKQLMLVSLLGLIVIVYLFKKI